MPPRSVRRSSRLGSRDPSLEPEAERETSRESPVSLARPRLPALRGTPSSRRQYTYGSGVEPQARTGHLQSTDLGNAINQAINKTSDDDVFVRPRRPRRAAAAADPEQDELAQPSGQTRTTKRGPSRRGAASNPNPPPPVVPSGNTASTTKPTAPVASGSGTASTLKPPVPLVPGSDADSLRSFNIESDYYGEASIESTLGGTPMPRDHQTRNQEAREHQIRERQERERQERKRQADSPETTRRLHGQSKDHLSPVSGTNKEAQQFEDVFAAALAAKSPSPGPSRRRNAQPERRQPEQRQPEQRQPEKRQPEQQQPQTQRDSEGPGESEKSDGLASRTSSRGHGRNANTPAPTVRMRQFSTRQVLSRKPDTVQEPEFEDDLEDKGHGDGRRTSRPPTQTAEGPKPDDGSRTTLRIESGGSRGLFAQANELNSKKTSFNTDTYPADRRERDAAIQRDISEAEDRVARERLARETREARRRRWAWFMSLWSLDWLFGLFRTPPPPVEEEEEDEHDDVTDGPTEWWRLLHPRTYGQTMLWLIDTIMDQVVDVMDRVSNANLRDYIPRPGKNFGMAAAGIFGLIVMALIGPVIIGMLRTFSLPDAGSLPSTGGIHLPSIGGIAGKIGGFIPSLAWPLRRSRGDLDDLFASLGPEDNAQELVNKVWEHYEKSIGAMKKDSRLHQASLQKLETVVPKIVRMELKNGKPIVTQEFWHALRDLIHGDGSFVTLEKNSGAYEFTSDEQWKAIRARLIKDPTYTSKLNATAAGIEDRLEAKMPRAWDAWVKNNEDKIAELIGPALDKIQSAGSGREFDERLKKIVKDQVQGGDLEDVIVTRAEFLHHLQNEFALHRAEIRAEIKALQPQLEELREEMQAATRNQPQGVSKGEIAALVKSLVLKAVGDMNLEGMAKGKIHYHWAAELKNQVNYFAIGAGATIDGKRTSTTYDPLDQGTVAPDAFIRGIRSVAPLPPIAALSPWEDEGDCWCAARSVNHRGNPHGATLSVQLGRRVVPQHVVVEHLLPGATSDPAARPRHIEVYAHFEDHVVRERVRDFAATHLPDATNDRDFQAPGYGPAFVKIAQFVYEGAELHDGVHVHRLHSDLAALGAATDQVIVRAVSNYGADTHTCFYRVRLFGKPLAIDEL